MPGIYGGDDISAIVLDAGSSSTRAGWAGEDTPRVVTPSHYGWLPGDEDEVLSKAAENSSTGEQVGAEARQEDAMQGVETNGGEPTTGAALTGEAGGAAPVDGEANDGRVAKKRAITEWEIQKRKAENRRRFVGDGGVNIWKRGLEIGNPLEDGVLSSAASLLALARYSLEDVMGARPSEHPLLLTEPSWNTKEAREEMMELAFEGLDVPAFYLANSTVLSSFAAGKPTSLIVDVGASQASAIPVVDGFILRKGIQKQLGMGGDCISRALLYDLSTNPPSQTSRTGGKVDITGHYLVKSKAPTVPGATATAKLREDRTGDSTTDSFRDYHRGKVLHEAKESLAQVLEEPWNEAQAAARPLRGFEFPDGYNDSFGIERFRAPEVLFTPQLFANSEGVLPPAPSTHFHRPIQDLIAAAIEATDVDSRATLLQNIVCVGSSTMIPGFNDRLSYELGLKLPGQKIKIHSPGNVVERRFSSWLGGSILASLGTFHQLWISKAEYQESGASIVNTRCR